MKAGLEKDPEVVNQLTLMRENLVATAQLKKIDGGIASPMPRFRRRTPMARRTTSRSRARHILIAPKGSPAVRPARKE